MADTDNDTDATSAVRTGPVLLAYDGSELAKLAIEEAGRQLAPRRDAVVVCVWQPADVGFTPPHPQHFDAEAACEVLEAAKETAAFGQGLAETAGFRAQSTTIEAAPTWKGIIEVAHEHQASIIVLGSNRHSGIKGHLFGNVAAAVVSHSAFPVLIVHKPS